MSKILGLDIGGSSVKWAVMDQDSAEILKSGSIPVDLRDDEERGAEWKRKEFIDSIADLFMEDTECEGIAISLPGTIDAASGFLSNPGALWFNRNCAFADELSAEVSKRAGRKIPVTLENDGKSAALAEYWKGNLQDVKDGVVMTLGTGIGGGIIVDGKLLRGSGFSAGEFSWLPTVPGLVELDNMAAVPGSITRMVAAIGNSKGVSPEEFDGRKAMELVLAEDEEACRIFDDTMSALAQVCYTVNCVLNPEKICIGGGISRQPHVTETIRRKYNEIIDHIDVPMPKAKIETCRFFSDANLIGALYNYNLQNNEDC